MGGTGSRTGGEKIKVPILRGHGVDGAVGGIGSSRTGGVRSLMDGKAGSKVRGLASKKL